MDAINLGRDISPHLENLVAFARGNALNKTQLQLLQRFGWVTVGNKDTYCITPYGQDEIRRQAQGL